MSDPNEPQVDETEVLEQSAEVEAASVDSQEQAIEETPKSAYVETDDPKVLERFGELTRKGREAERERDAERKRVKELEQQLAELNKPTPVDAPTGDLAIDDPDEFNRQLAAHQESIKAQALFEAQQAQQQQLIQREQQQILDRKEALFQQKAEESGIDPATLGTAVNIVVNAGISAELGEHLLDHPDGPRIVKHLANNPGELYDIISKSPLEAAAIIETSVKAKALQPKPKVSQAPEPTPVLSGNGAQPSDGLRHVGGATFE